MVYERLTERINGKLRLKKKFPSLNDTIDILASRLELYEDTGLSPEQVQELKKKQIAKKPVFAGVKYNCQCGWDFYRDKQPYCMMCGKAIDWE